MTFHYDTAIVTITLIFSGGLVTGRPATQELEGLELEQELELEQVLGSMEHDVNQEPALETDPNHPWLELELKYPTERVQQALNRSELRDLLRGQALPHERVKRETVNQDQFELRICEVVNKTFLPCHQRNSTGPDDTKEYNLPEGANLTDYIQPVHTEECRHGAEGHNKGRHHLNGHDNWCKQLYVEIPMLSKVEVDGEVLTDKIAIKKFRFKHGCSCYVED